MGEGDPQPWYFRETRVHGKRVHGRVKRSIERAGVQNEELEHVGGCPDRLDTGRGDSGEQFRDEGRGLVGERVLRRVGLGQY